MCEQKSHCNSDGGSCVSKIRDAIHMCEQKRHAIHVCAKKGMQCNGDGGDSSVA